MSEFDLIPAGFGLCWIAYYLRGVRRQTLWDQLALFLRDTFLPVASPV